LGLNVGITAAQVVGGVIAGSLSLLADAAHNGSDAVSLGTSYTARKIAQRQADPRRTFGYNRVEVVAALINLTVLFVIAAFLLYQAIMRLINPSPVDGTVMLIVGGVAFAEDALSAWLLYEGQKESLNIRSAFIHMIGDTLATVGVIIGAVLVIAYGVHWVDPVITATIAVYLFAHAYHEIRKAIRILIESAPTDFDFDGMVRAVQALEGVQDLHHVHLWRLDEERVALEAHLSILQRDMHAMEAIKRRTKELLREDFDIEHATLEIEVAGQTDHNPSVIRE
jgi:cobalt-zinc-cadmium efflux system protein